MAEKKQVLVICHTAAGQMYLGVLLNRIWYSPVLARTVEEGILHAQRGAFSLIVFDGDMPESNRGSAITLLKNETSVKNVPLVVFVTSENAALYESLISQGCSAVITKPIDLALAYDVLGRLSGQPRQAPRIPVHMRVEIEELIPDRMLTCINLSEGGMYLRTDAPIPEKTFLHIKFALPRDTGELKVAGEVVRTTRLEGRLETEPGMAIRFVNPSEDIRERIRNFVQWELMGDIEWKPNI